MKNGLRQRAWRRVGGAIHSFAGWDVFSLDLISLAFVGLLAIPRLVLAPMVTFTGLHLTGSCLILPLFLLGFSLLHFHA